MIVGDRGAVAPGHSAQLQILFDAHADESAARLRHMGDPEAHDVLGGPAGDRLAVEADLAAHPHHAADRAQRRRLAGAVGAEQGDDAALGKLEVEPVQRLALPVKGAQAMHLEHHRPRPPAGSPVRASLGLPR